MSKWLGSAIAVLAVVSLGASRLSAGGGAVIAVPGDQPTIQAAIDASMDGDEIVLANMIFIGAGNRDLDFQGKAVTLRSAGGLAQGCVIDCGMVARAMTFDDGEGAGTRIEDITIRNGRDQFFGGAMLIDGASPTFSGVRFEFNNSDDGGAAALLNGAAPTFEDCEFFGNNATRGGAIYASASAPVAESCLFDMNSADFGGATFNNAVGGDGRYTDCTFTDNEGAFGAAACNWTDSGAVFVRCLFENNMGLPGSSGGGMHNRASDVLAVNCEFRGNRAFVGGGVNNTSGATFDLINGALVGNIAMGAGGGLHNTNESTATVRNCAFVENDAAVGGGASTSDSPLNIANSIFWANTDDSKDGATAQIEERRMVTVAFSCVQGGWPGSGNVDADPMFVAGELSLQPGSPCIDAGSSGLLPPDEADLDGDGDTNEPLPLDLGNAARVVGGDVDAGPFESSATPPCPADFNGDGAVDAFDLAMLLTNWGPSSSVADFNDDGAVDAFDLAQLLTNWGPCPG